MKELAALLEYIPLKICLLLLLGFFGACVFSFLNVLVYRLPRALNFVSGRSFCPNCEHSLSYADTVPILSFLFLRGKCRYCKSPISWRYTIVEALGAALSVLCFLRSETLLLFALNFVFLFLLTAVSLIDIDTMEIHPALQYALLALAACSCLLNPSLGLLARGIGAICVSLPMFIIERIIPDGFGFGDIKLMAIAGLFLGWKLTLLSFFLAILTGGVYGIYLLLIRKKGRTEHFAFGPFLCLGMCAALFYGELMINWYISLL